MFRLGLLTYSSNHHSYRPIPESSEDTGSVISNHVSDWFALRGLADHLISKAGGKRHYPMYAFEAMKGEHECKEQYEYSYWDRGSYHLEDIGYDCRGHQDECYGHTYTDYEDADVGILPPYEEFIGWPSKNTD